MQTCPAACACRACATPQQLPVGSGGREVKQSGFQHSAACKWLGVWWQLGDPSYIVDRLQTQHRLPAQANRLCACWSSLQRKSSQCSAVFPGQQVPDKPKQEHTASKPAASCLVGHIQAQNTVMQGSHGVSYWRWCISETITVPQGSAQLSGGACQKPSP